MSSTFRIVEHKLPGQHIREYAQSSPHSQEHVHYIALKQYIPLQTVNPIPENAVTILGFHGNGFPKETYEPFFEDLHADLRKRNIQIRAIWMADSSNQGASGVLNEYTQGDRTSWYDHSRDVLHMVNHFREEMPRPIIGIGHSYGCVQLIHLATIHPRLLSTVILMEPIIFDPPMLSGTAHPALRTLSRRDLWPSHEDATKSLRKAFSYWDPRTVEAYIRHGLRQVPTAIYNNFNGRPAQPSNPTDAPPPHPLPAGAVTLTTTKAQESWSFSSYNGWPIEHDPSDTQQQHRNRLIHPDQSDLDGWPLTMIRPEIQPALDELSRLRPSALFVFGKTSMFSTPASIKQKLDITGTKLGGSGGAKAGKVKGVVIDRANHLVPFEKAALPVAVAECSDWLDGWLEGYRADEAFMKEYLAQKEGRASDIDGIRLSQEWVEGTKKPMGTLRPTRSKSKL